jgi:hypothetical protein
MGVETALIASALVAAAGTGYGVYSGEQAKNAAKNRADAEANRLKDQQAGRDANIAKIRESFGVGTSAEAQGNARTLADRINQFYQNQLSSNLKASDDQYASTSRTSRQNLARVGQLGSGLDTSNKSGNLADYLRSRSNAVASAAGSRDRLTNSLTNQRLGYENQVSGGTVANPDFGAISASRDATLSQAQGQVAPAAVGNLFNTAGSTYFNGKVQEAQGNQGLQAFGFSDSTNRGRIS